MAKKHIKTNAIRILEKANIDFEAKLYESDGFMDGVSVAKKLGQNLDEVYKTLVTENKSHEYFVFVIPVAEELDLKKCAASVGQKSLEMIHVKDITKVTGYIRGGCSPIGMKKQFKTVIDASAQNKDNIIFSGGKLGVQIKMSPNDLAELISADFADITA
ncbi:MAG: Cys-tRNA(Pro) deacylase [Clostridiales bacterium]|nr:Cys-tRNA(Pro) deacylase [Clostridiales bacterium]